MAPRTQLERGKSVEIERNGNAHQTPHRWNEEETEAGAPRPGARQRGEGDE